MKINRKFIVLLQSILLPAFVSGEQDWDKDREMLMSYTKDIDSDSKFLYAFENALDKPATFTIEWQGISCGAGMFGARKKIDTHVVPAGQTIYFGKPTRCSPKKVTFTVGGTSHSLTDNLAVSGNPSDAYKYKYSTADGKNWAFYYPHRAWRVEKPFHIERDPDRIVGFDHQTLEDIRQPGAEHKIVDQDSADFVAIQIR